MTTESASQFRAPVEDILFSLKYIASADRLHDWDDETTADLLNHFANFAEKVIAPTNRIGDLEGAKFVDGQVKLPKAFQSAYDSLASGGWQGLTAPQQYCGMAVNRLVAAGVSEIFSGANHALQMVCNLVPGAITLLEIFGTEAQKKLWIPKLVSGNTLSTMCLTEAGAGSDLSAIVCRAFETEDGWAVSGEKIFISGGGQNLSDNILHLVLARTDDAATGLEGLSLLLVSKQPSVKIIRLESKLGLHASPTCQLQFDHAKAELVGAVGGGLKAMFTLMNHARIDVGLQGVAHASNAAHIAAEYSQQRRQSNKCLYQYPDVHRMLCEQKIKTITARALCHTALVETELQKDAALVEFMTSLSKIAGSEAGIASADLGIQILGGYGYLEEYGLSQIWRDARITAIYEGTNGIHAKSLVSRGLKDKGGSKAFADLLYELADKREYISEQIDQWNQLGENILDSSEPLAYSRTFVEQTIQLFEKAVWHRIENVVQHHSDAEKLRPLIKYRSLLWGRR